MVPCAEEPQRSLLNSSAVVQTSVQHSHWGRNRTRSQIIWKVHRMPPGHSTTALGEQAGKGWSCVLICFIFRIILLWSLGDVYRQDQPQTLQAGSLSGEDHSPGQIVWLLKNSMVWVCNVQFHLGLINCDRSQGFLATLFPSVQSSAERTNWMDLLGPLPAVSWAMFVFCKGKTQADCFYYSFNRRSLH